MLRIALAALVISIIAGLFGFTGIAAGAAGVAKIMFGIFMFIAIVFFALVMMGIGALSR